MKKINNIGTSFYTFDKLSAFNGLLHFTSCADDRVNSNLGFVEWAEPGRVLDNRQRMAEAVGFKLEHMVVGQQTHSSNIAIVSETDAGKGAKENASRLTSTDALVTNKRNICLMVMTADCVPVLLFDPEKKVIAAIHAGWRGTVGGIVDKTIDLMNRDYKVNPENLVAAIGPSIGKCCFEVGEEVKDAFEKYYADCSGFVSDGKEPGKYQVDLREANRFQLLKAGVLDERIEVADKCTYCLHEEFYSYRYDRGETGRMGTGIVLL